MTLVVSHPTGNAFLRAVLRAVHRAGLLHGFWTSFAVPPRHRDNRLFGAGLRSEIGRRTFDEIPWAKTHVHPQREAVRILAKRLGLSALIRHETGWASVDRVYSHLDRTVAAELASSSIAGVRAIYAYEDAALYSFRAARARGLTCLYDLPIAHWRTMRRILEEERFLKPDWVPTIGSLADSAEKLARKDEEIALADHVLVASSFTKQSLQEHFGASLRISVTPYGAPAPIVECPANRKNGEPLHILYAGHLSQRKGLAYLIDALGRCDFPWKLTLAGSKLAEPNIELVRLLNDPRCRWLGHVPHATLLRQMSRAHAFVFPSLVEGFGLVILEAMAAGLPAITTPNTAGPDVITEGLEGFIVPIRDADAIADRLNRLYADEDARQSMALAALRLAAKSSWQGYEQKITSIISEATS